MSYVIWMTGIVCLFTLSECRPHCFALHAMYDGQVVTCPRDFPIFWRNGNVASFRSIRFITIQRFLSSTQLSDYFIKFFFYQWRNINAAKSGLLVSLVSPDKRRNGTEILSLGKVGGRRGEMLIASSLLKFVRKYRNRYIFSRGIVIFPLIIFLTVPNVYNMFYY